MDPRDRLRPEELTQHREFLCRLARSLLHDATGAEDVVHGAFALALARPPRDVRGLAVWLRTVVRRLALNVRRHERRRRAREQVAARPEARGTDEAAMSLEIQEFVIGAVRALEEPYRTTLWLRYYEDLSRKEIARRQGVPERTVQTRLARGLTRLREELDRRSGGDRSRWLGGVLLLARTRTGAPLTLLAGETLARVLIAGALVLVVGAAWRLMPRASAPTSVPDGTIASAVQLDTADLATPRPASRTPLEPEPVRTHELGALRIRVRWDDGTPAGGVGLYVFPEDDPLGERNVVRTRTDDAGLATVESIHAGGVRIEADRGAERTAVAVAGKEVEVTLDLPAGTDVEGTVTDASGAPVAGAEILLVSSRNGWLATRVVATADASGAYRIRAVGQDVAVSARAEGYVPAFLHPLTEAYLLGEDGELALQLGLAFPPERNVHADLVLDWIDFALRGVVRDPEQRPVAGALVAVGRNQSQGYRSMGGPTRRRLGMPVARTDENGRFAASGVEHTGMPVAVMADGFPIQIASFPGWTGSVTYGEIVLDPPGSIEGVVVGPDGAAVEGAELSVQALAGRCASEIPFPLPHARSSAGGRFRLGLLSPGAVPIRVAPPAGSTLGPGFASVRLAPGETARLEIHLPLDATIRGRALDARGVPLAGVDVSYISEGTAVQRRVSTDGEGRFAIEDCARPPYRLRLIEPGGWRILSELANVAAGPEEVQLRAPPVGRVTGVFVDDGRKMPPPGEEEAETEPLGRRPSSALPGMPSVSVSDRAGSRSIPASWSGESFVCENVPAGTYRLTIRTDASLIHRSEWFELRGGETHDLGVIRSQAAVEEPGSLALEVSPGGLAGLSSVLHSPGHDVVDFLREEGGARRARQLAPGRYFVSVRADGMGDACVPVEIRAGEEARVRVRLEPGAARTLSFPVADPAATWSELKVTVKGSDGLLIAVARLPVPFDDSRALLVHVPVGRFTVEAEADTGLGARGAFSVDALTEQDAPLVFELR